jgi:hypothetical protein
MSGAGAAVPVPVEVAERSSTVRGEEAANGRVDPAVRYFRFLGSKNTQNAAGRAPKASESVSRLTAMISSWLGLPLDSPISARMTRILAVAPALDSLSADLWMWW